MEDEAARAALAALIRERREDYAGLSRLLGRNAAYIQQYVKRGTPRRLSEDDRRLLARYFGVREEALGGPAPREVRVAAAGDGAARRAADLILVPRLALGASAGGGRVGGDERPAAEMPFSAAVLRELGAGRHAALSMIKVEGDSMLPTLADGDDILVDGDDAVARLREGIYVLRLDDGLMVKRLAPAPDGGLSVTSDNPAGPRWSGVDRAAIRIVGRVIWAGRRLR